MTWLTALVACPAPTGPMCVIVRPIAARIGLARSTSASVPPTMIVRVPCSAPSEPPETGASTKPTPPAASRAAKPSLAPGLMVGQATIRLPARAPAAGPPAPPRGRGPARRAVPDRQREAGPRQVGGHGRAHRAHAREADPLHALLLSVALPSAMVRREPRHPAGLSGLARGGEAELRLYCGSR